jgi:hypothetical protein
MEETKEVIETLEEKARIARLNEMRKRQELLNSVKTRNYAGAQFKHRYTHTRGGKTKKG